MDLVEKAKQDKSILLARKYFDADMVLIMGKYLSGRNTGRGANPTSKDQRSFISAYSVVLKKPFGSMYQTIAHELGHNFGCEHEYDHALSMPMYPYGYAYVTPDGQTTIMGHILGAIPLFSNPDLHYSGAIIGDAETANNARLIRENRFFLAKNNEMISGKLEEGDVQDGHDINASFNSKDDYFDDYFMCLSGDTNLSIDSEGFTTIWYEEEGDDELKPHFTFGFELDLYDENTHQYIDTYDVTHRPTTLKKGNYRLSFNRGTDYNFTSPFSYSVHITTGDTSGCVARENTNFEEENDTSSGGGCTYNPNNNGMDAVMFLMITISMLYPFRRKFISDEAGE